MTYNITLPEAMSQCMPQSACSFYHGYYTMSTHMGLLILRLGLLFFILDILHILLKNLFEKVIEPWIKKQFEKPKAL